MLTRIQAFLRSDTGAVTVDWVVLSAGIIAIAVAIVGALRSDTVGLADNIGSYMASQ